MDVDTYEVRLKELDVEIHRDVVGDLLVDAQRRLVRPAARDVPQSVPTTPQN